MNQEAQYTTEFGGISSLLIIVIVILFFFSNILDFFAKSQVFTDDETLISSDPQLLELNSDNYMLAVSIEQTNYSQNPFFNISIEQRDANGELKKTITYIQLQECRFDQFDKVFSKQGINFTEQFNTLGLKNWLCPKDDFKILLKGTYSSDQFSFIKLVVKECENSNSQNQSWNPICANEQVKQQYLNKEGQFKLQLYQINTIINLNKPQNYLTQFLDSDMYFTFVPKKLSRQANIYFRESKIINDNSLLPYKDQTETNAIVRKNEDFRDLTELGRDADDQYAIIYMRRSQFTQIVYRKFLKLGELLSYLGGVVQIMRLLFGIVIVFCNRQLMLIELSNKLYDFKEIKQKRSEQLSPPQITGSIPQDTARSKYIEDQLNSPDPDVILDVRNDVSLCPSTTNIKNAIDKILDESNPIRFSFKLFLNKLTCGFMFKDRNAILLEKAIDRMNQDLDLHSILYRIQEISKIKKLLFNEQQMILFNFTPKPLISLNSNSRVPSRLLIHDSKISRLKRLNNLDIKEQDQISCMLLNAYVLVKDEIPTELQSNCSLKINQKLIELMIQETKDADVSYKHLTQTPKKPFISFKFQMNDQQNDQEQINENNVDNPIINGQQ
ncbi:unnamed protein product (macronuclear) [Paramecium tetraurelia]|uniref:Transmembrane protein n=1 Tax=Paramecium tetraurelia TaxID=5888 RepID=A0CGV8_PARTE|nr:uncharacterized protein GSPATT00007465001 [Paramecium tetraurelia]CAK70025.1 unnamed protein product [Paramecium tetraurelia]|eukprot:XP_001437422.1 hypothetical protein (macronuclear) [Paramecium tetraurelia strain d4-2]